MPHMCSVLGGKLSEAYLQRHLGRRSWRRGGWRGDQVVDEHRGHVQVWVRVPQRLHEVPQSARAF